ncbi:hypothetical protein BACEGG_00067 [Bacteroides eggerthii DSM 20697]|nr:hypothetical protein BACEGG_00067 [Bacteroides eggerthii DSM 20697]
MQMYDICLGRVICLVPAFFENRYILSKLLNEILDLFKKGL